MRFPLSCVLAISLGFAAHSAVAQLKLKESASPNLTTSSPTAAPAPAPAPAPADPAREAKEKAAIEAAQRWLKLLDAGEFGKAWDESGTQFQSRVTRKQWVEGLPKDRTPFGALKSRTVEGLGYPKEPQGLPKGEYIQVGFSSVFDKQSKIVEVVTVVLDGGTWRPIGYLIQ